MKNASVELKLVTGRQDKNEHVLLPSERFYWAVLDASTLPGRPRNTTQLGYLFENYLPVPIENVHAVYARHQSASGRHWIACGMQREDLQKALEGVPPDTVMLGPAEVPEFVGPSIDSRTLNLLTGAFEPRAVRTLRARWLLCITAMIVMCTAVLVFGLERRRLHYEGGSVQLRAARQNIYAMVLGSPALDQSASSTSRGHPPDLRLIAEARQLQQTRQQPASIVAPTDVSETLAKLLSRWPHELIIETESILITPTALTIRGSALSTGDVQELADALGKLEGWQLQQPQVSASGQTVQAALQLKPLEEQSK